MRKCGHGLDDALRSQSGELLIVGQLPRHGDSLIR
jgi:hypothetical protein